MSTLTATRSSVRLNTRFLFDVAFGVFMPLICLLVDSIIFKSGKGSPGSVLLNPSFKIAAYTSIGISVTALSIWLIFRREMTAYSGYLDGIFHISQVAAFLLALYLLPESLTTIGKTGFGLLGLTLFVTSFVFFRQRIRAQADASMLRHHRRKVCLGILAMIIIPMLLQDMTTRYVNNALFTILNTPESSSTAVTQLKAAFWCGDDCFYQLPFACYQAVDDNDLDRVQYLASIYRELTGHAIPPRPFPSM